MRRPEKGAHGTDDSVFIVHISYHMPFKFAVGRNEMKKKTEKRRREINANPILTANKGHLHIQTITIKRNCRHHSYCRFVASVSPDTLESSRFRLANRRTSRLCKYEKRQFNKRTQNERLKTPGRWRRKNNLLL